MSRTTTRHARTWLAVAALAVPCAALSAAAPAHAATCTDPATSPSVSIHDASVVEGDTGTRNIDFPLTISTPVNTDVTVTASTTDGTATAPPDYQGTTAALGIIPACSTIGHLYIPVVGDTVGESDETFTVTLTAATRTGSPAPTLTGGDDTATGTIIDDDGGPVSASALEACDQTSTAFTDAIADGYQLHFVTSNHHYVGGSNKELIIGTNGPDRIDGGSKDDIICGMGGRDRIDGGSGADQIDGGAGHDTIDGGSGTDTIVDTANGHDNVLPSSGNDSIS
jgi:Ca2+-binding RTX toxin-like protein